MGLHEWLLQRGLKYAPNDELQNYLAVYTRSERYAEKWSREWNLSEPVKTRAIAPTGTIGIIAETTTGIEPIFCVAYKRRYLKYKTWYYQYVIDPTAARLIRDSGVDPESIEDAYSIPFGRRLEFQAWVQQFVDHGISSTINLPPWGSSTNHSGTVKQLGNLLMGYLPTLRGITCYPDGARGGQPLVPVKYATAIKHQGEELVEEYTDICDITGKGGPCGS